MNGRGRSDEERTVFHRGLVTRSAVLGEEWVTSSYARAADDAFKLAIQDYITRAAWGDVWSRPGLSLKTRSLIVIGLCVALNRPHELSGHIRAGIQGNGCTRKEVEEAIFQTAPYCGIPAMLDACRVAEGVFEQLQD